MRGGTWMRRTSRAVCWSSTFQNAWQEWGAAHGGAGNGEVPLSLQRCAHFFWELRSWVGAARAFPLSTRKNTTQSPWLPCQHHFFCRRRCKTGAPADALQPRRARPSPPDLVPRPWARSLFLGPRIWWEGPPARSPPPARRRRGRGFRFSFIRLYRFSIFSSFSIFEVSVF